MSGSGDAPRRIFDISPPLHAGTAVFPGDTPLSREVLMDLRKGDAITLSTLRGTVHLGAHLDAPSHYGSGGEAIDETDLGLVLGPCLVLDVSTPPGGRVTVERVSSAWPAGGVPPRVLLHTGSYPDPAVFSPDFAPLDPEVVHWMADRGVRVVGVDTPSVDPADSKTLPAHAACFARDVRILEGLSLGAVSAGEYELVALPLRLVGFDASPVRAVLRELTTGA